MSLQEKDILAPPRRRTGERELAFKHVLIRDVAYGMLPKAVRSRKHFEVGAFIEERAGDRTDEVVALLAEHYGRAAALGRESGVPPQELEPMRGRALRFLEEAGDAAALLYSNREAAVPLPARAPTSAGRSRRRGADRREARRRVAAPGARGRGHRASGTSASSGTAARRTSSAWPTCTARSAPRCPTRASARPRSSTTRRASTC